MTVISKITQTLATLEGTKGTLTIYSLQEQDEKARAAYKDALGATHEIIRDMETRVKDLEFEEPQYKKK